MARSYELKDRGSSAEFFVDEHEADGFVETEFYLPDTFPIPEEPSDYKHVRDPHPSIGTSVSQLPA